MRQIQNLVGKDDDTECRSQIINYPESDEEYATEFVVNHENELYSDVEYVDPER